MKKRLCNPRRLCLRGGTAFLVMLLSSCGEATHYEVVEQPDIKSADANKDPSGIGGVNDYGVPDGGGTVMVEDVNHNTTDDTFSSQAGGDQNGGSNQGNDDQMIYTAEEFFIQDQENSKSIDLLFVVDNSGSMAEEQHNLSTKLSAILDLVAPSDWRVAVRTTDAGEQNLRLLLEKSDSTTTMQEKVASFEATIQSLGTSGSGNEQGLPMAVRGLKSSKPQSTTPWLRDDSLAAVLIVSDEDNCSTGCAGGAAELVNFMDENYRGENIGRVLGETAKVYGLIRPEASLCPQAYHVGLQYVDAINATGGVYGKICDSDYTTALQQISADISTTLNINFQLAYQPIVSSVEVYVDGVKYQHVINVVNKTVALEVAPSAGSEIRISYDYF